MTVRSSLVEAFGWEHDPATWTHRAACNGQPVERWFPSRGESAEPARIVCRGCPVRFECLDYALRWRIEHGVWGGLSARQRGHLTSRPLPKRLPRKAGCGDHCECDGCRQARYRRHRQLALAEEAI